MNQRTTKLLRRYSVKIGKNFQELKLWWNSLNWRERTKERIRIKEELT